MEEKARVNADLSSLIMMSGNSNAENHAFADWFRQLRFEGWEAYEKLPMPSRSDEAWRFATVKALDVASYKRPSRVTDAKGAELVERSVGLDGNAARMVFANDALIDEQAMAEPLRSSGVIFAPIERAVIEHGDLFRRHFMTQEVVLGSRKFAALHKACVRSGTFLYVPRNVEVDLPVEAFHWLDGDLGSVFPHTLLILEENAKLTFVDYFSSSSDPAVGMACGMNDLYLGAGAQLEYVNVQNWSRNALALQINSTVVGPDASATSMNLNLGGSYARTESVSRLVGRGGRSEMLAVSVADGTQEYDQRTLQDHREPDTASDLLYKNSLDDRARTIFAGLIRVEPNAHRTDAYQKVRNLLLSDDAEANSMPGLEIMADEVRCTHGATSGQIEEEELFYLLSRGIPPEAAQKLIVLGFLNEGIERVKNAPIRERLKALVRARLGQSARNSV
jgi:Fe-S cluster assembly protein SufD